MKETHRPAAIARPAVLAFFLCGVLAGCGNSNNNEDDCVVDTSYNPVIQPGAFVADVDNPLYPLADGRDLHLRGGRGDRRGHGARRSEGDPRGLLHDRP